MDAQVLLIWFYLLLLAASIGISNARKNKQENQTEQNS
jgi:hypothetical protein